MPSVFSDMTVTSKGSLEVGAVGAWRVEVSYVATSSSDGVDERFNL